MQGACAWMKKIIAIIIILALIIAAVVFFTAFSYRPNIGPFGIKSFNKGMAYPAALIAALMPGPIQSDLEKRGLVSLGSNSSQGSSVDLGQIQSLIQQGMYFIDPNNHMQAGPVSIPSQVFQFTGTNNYIYALRATQLWAALDNFSFTGHTVKVSIPANLDFPANGPTTHNLYNTHLTLPDGRWVESGVGWVSWAQSPIIYTYESYTGRWNFESIPAGSQRDILLKIEISPNLQATMSASDPQSGKSVTSQQQVGALNHRVDLTQEQFSNTNQWLNTPHVQFHDSQIKNNPSDNWVSWDNSVVTSWVNNPPMYESKGVTNGQIWTETWCSTQ